MSIHHSDRATFLKATGLSLLGFPLLAGMARPGMAVRPLQGVGPDAHLALPEEIAKIADLSTLAAIIANTPSFYQLLETGGPYTIFAPSNEAFSRLTPGQMKKLQNPTIAQNVLEYHVINGIYKYHDFQTGMYATLLGPSFRLVREGGESFVNHALVQRQFPATNGEGHIIDKVLMRGFRGA